MKPSVLANRNSGAQKRIATAAATIAFRCSVTAPTVPVTRDSAIGAMCYLENLATFLEALVDVEAAKLANVLNIAGVTNDSKTAIRNYYGIT